MSSLTRRQLMVGGVALGVAASGLGLNRRALNRHREEAFLILTSSLRNPTSLIAVGDLYLSTHQDESNVSRLDSLIFPGIVPVAWNLEVEAARLAFARSVAADFRRGDLVELDGWQYSRTEARLAARYALSRPVEG